MPFCKNCGSYVPENATFCSSCGSTVANNANKSQYNYDQYQTNYNNTNNNYGYISEEQDIKENKIMAALSYIGILVLIPAFLEKNSNYARFHAIQGFTLFIFSVAYSILGGTINTIMSIIFESQRHILFIPIPHPIASIVSGIISLGSLAFFVLSIIGFINAVQGKKAKLPIIGKFDILSKLLK